MSEELFIQYVKCPECGKVIDLEVVFSGGESFFFAGHLRGLRAGTYGLDLDAKWGFIEIPLPLQGKKIVALWLPDLPQRNPDVQKDANFIVFTCSEACQESVRTALIKETSALYS